MVDILWDLSRRKTVRRKAGYPSVLAAGPPESYRAESIPQALMDAMGDFVAEGLRSGVLKDTAGLKSTAEGFRVRSSGNQLKVTDGPFTESKEVVGGYALVEVASKEEALHVARQFMELHCVHWPAFEWEREVRPLEDM